MTKKTEWSANPAQSMAFKQLLASSSDWAKTIKLGLFIEMDMPPCSVLQNASFKPMLKVIKPHYKVPSHLHFSQQVTPALYKEDQDLSKTSAMALRTDGSSRDAASSIEKLLLEPVCS